MRFKSRKIRSNRRSAQLSNRHRLGIAAVEFAIVAPFLVLLIFMMVEASRFMTSLNATAGAAREVARLVAVSGVDDTAALEHAKAVMKQSLFETDRVEVVVNNEPSSVPGMNMISVEVSIDFADVSLIGDPFNLGVTNVRGFSSMLREEE